MRDIIIDTIIDLPIPEALEVFGLAAAVFGGEAPAALAGVDISGSDDPANAVAEAIASANDSAHDAWRESGSIGPEPQPIRPHAIRSDSWQYGAGRTFVRLSIGSDEAVGEHAQVEFGINGHSIPDSLEDWTSALASVAKRMDAAGYGPAAEAELERARERLDLKPRDAAPKVELVSRRGQRTQPA